jgi:hypothetical protein
MEPLNGRKPRYTELYFSFDVEADGPIPGPYSMSSIGMCVAGEGDGKRFRRLDPESATFYRELRPISEDFDPESAAVAGLDRDELLRSGADPETAMRELAAWVREEARGRTPVAVAWPLSFDWMWTYWYFRRFGDDSPFGFSGCLDMKTLYCRLRQKALVDSSKSRVPRDLLSTRQHTHNALDDALEQADFFANMMERDPRTIAVS